MNSRKRNVRTVSKQLKMRCLSYINQRETGFRRRFDALNMNSICSRLPMLWEGRKISLKDQDKIFACQWISPDHVVIGTKCNTLGILNCTTKKLQPLPLIEGTNTSIVEEQKCGTGIHAIQINPSQSFLATGGKSVSTVGVYGLPDLSPYCLFEKHHKNCVFDLRWLDDACLASCSRDSSLALWRLPCSEKVNPRAPKNSSFVGDPSLSIERVIVDQPIASVVSELPDDRFRALEYLPTRGMFALVSMSRHFYLYDAERLFGSGFKTPFHTIYLRYSDREAVALRKWPLNPHILALATHRSVLLFDIRCPSQIRNTAARCVHPPASASSWVRSLNFSGNFISYGTSAGKVHFYDLVADKHLPMHLDIESQTKMTNNVFELSSFPPRELDDLPDLASEYIQHSSPRHEDESEPVSPFLIDSFLNSVASSTSQVHRTRSRTSSIRSVLNSSSESSIIDLSSRSLLGSISRTRAGLERLMARLAQLRQTTAELRLHRALIDSLSASSNLTNTASSLRDFLVNVSTNERATEHFMLQSTDNASATTSAVESDEPPLTIFSRFPPVSTPGTNTAVYTHEYDLSGTRLFTAGGPIASAFSGNFAVIWE